MQPTIKKPTIRRKSSPSNYHRSPARRPGPKRRPSKGKGKMIAAAACVVALCGVFLIKNFWITKPRDATDMIFDVPLYVTMIPEGSEGRPGTLRQIKYIVIHETGNTAKGADAKSHAQFLQNGGEGATSWHYTVDDSTIYQQLPDNEEAFHAGDGVSGDGNTHGIAIEICVNEDGNFKKAMKNAEKLAGYLMNAYGLDESALKQHADFISKNCPETIREEGLWEDFKEEAAKYAAKAK